MIQVLPCYSDFNSRWSLNLLCVFSFFIFTAIMTDRKAVIKNADMSEDMQQDAVDCATQAMEKYNIEKDIAAYIKKVIHRTFMIDTFFTDFINNFEISFLIVSCFLEIFSKAVNIQICHCLISNEFL